MKRHVVCDVKLIHVDKMAIGRPYAEAGGGAAVKPKVTMTLLAIPSLGFPVLCLQAISKQAWLYKAS
jgi:hypothetical protein